MLKQGINGHRLLSTTVEDLPVFHIDKLGHQEIFMGAIDLLRDFVIKKENCLKKNESSY